MIGDKKLTLPKKSFERARDLSRYLSSNQVLVIRMGTGGKLKENIIAMDTPIGSVLQYFEACIILSSKGLNKFTTVEPIKRAKKIKKQGQRRAICQKKSPITA